MRPLLKKSEPTATAGNDRRPLLCRPKTSVVGQVARAIEQAELDRLYLLNEGIAHRLAFVCQGASFERMVEAEVADWCVRNVLHDWRWARLCDRDCGAPVFGHRMTAAAVPA